MTKALYAIILLQSIALTVRSGYDTLNVAATLVTALCTLAVAYVHRK